jgi:hypothetical protein
LGTVEYPLGLSLTETDDDHFILARRQTDGNVVSIRLTLEEMIGAKTKLDLWTAQALQYAQDKSDSVRAIVSHPVAGAEIAMDALQANVLLTLVVPTGERMTFGIPPPVAKYILDEIPPLLQMLDGSEDTH